MNKKDYDYFIITIIVCVIFSFLTIFMWFFLGWISLLIFIPSTIFLELYLLQWADKKHVIEEKQKFIQLGLISPSDTQIITKDGEDEFEQLKNFVRLNLTDLNELLASLEEGYRESLEKLDSGDIEDAKLLFNSISKDIIKKYDEITKEFENLFKDFPIPEDKEKKFLYDSYKEHWNAEDKLKKEKMDEIIKKFKVRSVFTVHLEDILQTEIENERTITDKDIKKMRVPYQQVNQLIKFIEKPIKMKIENFSPKEKQKYGKVGRKIIETCSKTQITPNLPYLVVKLGVNIQEAKKILTYLHLVGMIDEIYYHYKKKEILPR